MARSFVLLSFVFIVVVASIHARSIEHHVRTRAVCPTGMCQSKFGYCGDTVDYCGEGCQAGACYGGPCPPGKCLSRFGYCGTDDAYCGVGCKAGPCHSGAATLPSAVNVTLPSAVNVTLPSAVNITLPSGISSDPCPAGMCLSKFGYCGDTIGHCGDGCQAGACYGGPCPIGMCLSKHGFCGTSDAYCGVGCRAGPCYGSAITLPPVVTVSLPSIGTSSLPPVVTVTLPSIGTSSLPSISTTGLPSGVDDHSGDGTFYDPGLGACGVTNSGTDFVAAIAAPDFDPNTPNGNPNRNSLCGQRILVTGPKGTVTVTAADRCPVCKSGDLDLSPAAFDQIADQSAGRVPITWQFI